MRPRRAAAKRSRPPRACDRRDSSVSDPRCNPERTWPDWPARPPDPERVCKFRPGEGDRKSDVVPEIDGRTKVEYLRRWGSQTQERTTIKQSKFSAEQVTYALRQADGGTAVADVCRPMAIHAAPHDWSISVFADFDSSRHLPCLMLDDLRKIRPTNYNFLSRSRLPITANASATSASGYCIT